MLVGYYDPQVKVHEPTDNEKILALMKYRVEFTVCAHSVDGEEKSIRFSFGCLIDKVRKLTWDLKKTSVGLGILNQRVEEECNCSIPIYYSLIGSLLTKNKAKLLENSKTYL